MGEPDVKGFPVNVWSSARDGWATARVELCAPYGILLSRVDREGSEAEARTEAIALARRRLMMTLAALAGEARSSDP